MKVITLLFLFSATLTLLNSGIQYIPTAVLDLDGGQNSIAQMDSSEDVCEEDLLRPTYSKGDSWLLNVDNYKRMPDNRVYETYSLEIKIEDTAFQGDSAYYVISYWPSKKLGAPDGEGIIGIMSIVEKKTNRVLSRQKFEKDENDKIKVLSTRSMKPFHPSGKEQPPPTYYGYSGRLGRPEGVMPLVNIPFENMKDSCIGSLKPRRGEIPDGIEIESKCDTSKLCFSKYWRNDTLITEVMSRRYYGEDFTGTYRLYFTENSKWWVKHESVFTTPEGYEPCMACPRPGKLLVVTLLEENLVDSKSE